MNRNKEKVLQRTRTNWMCMLAEGRMFKGQSLIKGNLVVRLSRAKGMLEKKFDHSLKSEISREVEFLSNQRLLLSFQRFQLKPRLSNWANTPFNAKSIYWNNNHIIPYLYNNMWTVDQTSRQHSLGKFL